MEDWPKEVPELPEPTVDEIRESLRRLAEGGISTLPWRPCGAGREDGGCVCGMIWSVKDDIHIATAHEKHEDAPGPGLERMRANAAFIAAACSAAVPLLDLADNLEQQIQELKQDHGLAVHTLKEKLKAAQAVVQDFKGRLNPKMDVEPLSEGEKKKALEFGAGDAVREYCHRAMPGLQDLEVVGSRLVDAYFEEIGRTRLTSGKCEVKSSRGYACVHGSGHVGHHSNADESCRWW